MGADSKHFNQAFGRTGGEFIAANAANSITGTFCAMQAVAGTVEVTSVTWASEWTGNFNTKTLAQGEVVYGKFTGVQTGAGGTGVLQIFRQG